jgi:hypothetical protein
MLGFQFYIRALLLREKGWDEGCFYRFASIGRLTLTPALSLGRGGRESLG